MDTQLKHNDNQIYKAQWLLLMEEKDPIVISGTGRGRLKRLCTNCDTNTKPENKQRKTNHQMKKKKEKKRIK